MYNIIFNLFEVKPIYNIIYNIYNIIALVKEIKIKIPTL